jgi:hypothetical protein
MQNSNSRGCLGEFPKESHKLFWFSRFALWFVLLCSALELEAGVILILILIHVLIIHTNHSRKSCHMQKAKLALSVSHSCDFATFRGVA